MQSGCGTFWASKFLLNPLSMVYLIYAHVWYLLAAMLVITNRQHYEIDDCLEDNREDYWNYHYVNYICMCIMEFLQFLVLLFCVSVKVKLTVPLLYVYVHSA